MQDEHPAAAKQREAMHKQVRRDAELRECELAELRRQAEQRDARRNEVMTRGEILDAIDSAIDGFGSGTLAGIDAAAVTTLRALREAFE